MRILLIEDNPVDRMFVSRSLSQVEDFAHDLTHCELLSEAIELLLSRQFDIILLDLWLPDSEGVETCHRLITRVGDTPVVVMTATDNRELATEAMRCGAQDYLVKGAFPGSAIARVLQYAIDRHRFRGEIGRRESHFHQILSHVPAIIWTTNSDMIITSVEGTGLQTLELDSHSIIGRSLEEQFRAADKAEGAMRAHRAAFSGQPVAFETELQGRIFEVRIDPMYDHQKQPVAERNNGQQVTGTIGVALDVTERRTLDREMTFARMVQEALLPAKHPVLDGFDIFGGSHPARKTCGDWFDYLTFPDGSIGLVVGDVSGKGFGPAILSATIEAYLDVLAEYHTDMREILDRCNRLVCKRGLDGQFAVLSIARLQPGIRAFTYAGAGESMLIVNRSGKLKQKIPSSGVPLGLVDDLGFDPPAHVALEPGDILLLLTDGFREAANRGNALFGEDRIVQTVAAYADASASEIFSGLLQTVREFAQGSHQRDDMTGIVVKVLGD